MLTDGSRMVCGFYHTGAPCPNAGNMLGRIKLHLIVSYIFRQFFIALSCISFIEIIHNVKKFRLHFSYD